MKVAGYNLGCKVNKYELDAILSDFENDGFEVVEFDEKADVYIVSTCAVTALAEKKSRKYINRTKKMNPNAITVALGCYIQKAFNDNDDLIEDELLQSIDIFLGTKEKSKVLELVKDELAKRQRQVRTYDVTKYCDYENQKLIKMYDMTRAYVKIQDGCNNFCSYCIIPYVRGRERSRKLEDIMEEIHGLEQNGACEVVLTGIEVASYGKDLDNISLIDVIEKVNETSIERIRLSSLEQGIITEEFLERLTKVKKFCPHFHLSLQSGSDSVLLRMNRKYDTKKYFEKVQLIRKYFPLAAITTDIIVGFPEETDEEYNETKEFAKKVEFSDIHIFPYSIRTGTVAARKPQVSENIKDERAKDLEIIKYELIKNFEDKNLNEEKEVLIEQEIEFENKTYYVGHSKNFIKVMIEKTDDKNLTNTILKVKLKESLKEEMIGEILWED
ncbi:MAG: tRNA (N(6)-L-threonylcarbamoyladenosine(37)-C(2))-methylthiotransferase MtaB [Clostridia bacterium]|nr:tRNA (N(6)-L-threonylcarbamoyladenosine(37)-C(2))-methylthiotransferase MtaB [Clostridia bacterium]